MFTYWQAWFARRSLSATKTWVIISPRLTFFSFQTLIPTLSLQFILTGAILLLWKGFCNSKLNLIKSKFCIKWIYLKGIDIKIRGCS